MADKLDFRKNKTLLWGVGIAAALGLGVWWARRKSGGSSSSSTSPSLQYAGGYVPPAAFDSTGTDVAAWLGNYSGSLQNQLTQYGQSLTDTEQALKDMLSGQQATSPLSTVTGLTEKVSGDQATFSWNPVAGANWYDVFFRNPQTGQSTGGYDINATTITADLTKLNIGQGQSLEALVVPHASLPGGSTATVTR